MKNDKTLSELAMGLSSSLGYNCPGCDRVHSKCDQYCGRCSSGLSGPLKNAVDESIQFSGPLPTGGGAGSFEQPEYDRRHNVWSAPEAPTPTGAMERPAGDTLTNMTASTELQSDGPEEQRAEAELSANAKGNTPRNKYTSELSDEGLDNGVTHSESFTGTGAIAIAPNVSFQKSEDDEEDEDANDTSESLMSRRRNQTLNEWEPPFEAGGYEPGDYQMPSPKGNGVAKKNVKKDKVGSYDTATSNKGKEWPRDHNETAAMCDVDDDGVEHKSQGGHESSVGDPKDGHQDEMGHNWPNQAKNSGGGVAEPFDGTRWSDGGTLKGGSGQSDFGKAKTGASKMPSSGPIKGTSGPQYGEPQESRWSPNLIGSLMEGENLNVRVLFNNYARQTDYVCLEDFVELCRAHGSDASLNEESLLTLMDHNTEFVFHEGRDASGRYWVGQLIESDCCDKCGCDPCECDDDCVEEGAVRRPFRRTISELQVRSPEEEASMHKTAMPGDPDPMAMDAEGDEMMDFDQGMGYDDSFGAYQDMDMRQGPGPMSNMADMQECPECGATGQEDFCAECGTEIGGMGEESLEDPNAMAMDDMDMGMDQDAMDMNMGPGSGMDLGSGMGEEDLEFMDHDIDNIDANIDHSDMSDMQMNSDMGMDGYGEDPLGDLGPGQDEFGMEDDMPMESRYTPRNVKALKAFMESAKRITSAHSDPRSIGRALTESWRYYAGGIDARTTPPPVKVALKQLMSKFKTFSPLTESDVAMGADQGKSIADKSMKVSPDLAADDQPGPDLDDHGDPMGGSQKNIIGTPVVKGTGKGMEGGKVSSEAIRKNVSKLARHVKKSLDEAVRGVNGKYGLTFTALVREGRKKNRTVRRRHLAEALADVEELIQVHGSNNVVLEAYVSQNKRIVRKFNVGMIPVKSRGPLVSEGRAIFRFDRNAQKFASTLVMEGVTCRVGKHNWGRAVAAKASPKQAKAAFRMLSE